MKKKQNLFSNWIMAVSVSIGVLSTALYFLSSSSFFTGKTFYFASLIITVASLIFGFFYSTKNLETYVKVDEEGVSWKYKAWSVPTVLPWAKIKDIEKKKGDLVYHLQNGKRVRMGLYPLGTTTSTQVMNKIFTFCKTENILANGVHFQKAEEV